MPRKRIQIEDNFWLCDAEQIDSAELFRLVEKNKAYLSSYLPWAKKFNSGKLSSNFIERSIQRKKDKLEDYYLLLQDDFIIGALSIKTENQPTGHGEAGYWISENYSGKGLTTKALKALIKHCFQKTRLSTLTIRTHQNNIASIRVAQKCGFKNISTQNIHVESKDFLYFELEKTL
jgi:ribosomal-protein-serine acetyltransferase